MPGDLEAARRRVSRRRRRRVIGLALGATVLAAAWTGVQLWRVQQDLGAARDAATEVGRALEVRDGKAARESAARMRTAASAAAARTDGWWWSALELAPGVGDDVAGIRAVSASLEVIATDGVDPMADAAIAADHLTLDGRVDLALVRRVEPRVAEADEAVSSGAAILDGVEPGTLSPLWRSDYEEYAGLVGRLDRALGSARTALEVLPGMVGADGPRDYLLVFQNNAEIRAAGGVPGSWARVHADGGRLTMVEQGSAAQFGEADHPVLPLSAAERRIYGPQLGTYFQDATFTPDFPRAAELMAARWEQANPATRLDGVVSVDTVALAYALEGIGPVPAGEVTLTAANVVDVLLRDVYAALPVSEQDAAFQLAARAVFDASQGELASVPDFLAGVDRAVQEGRVRIVSFHRDEADLLAGSRVTGAAPPDDGHTPQVGVTLDDATGSKMSYYLRHAVTVETTDCTDGRQALRGRVLLDQVVSQEEARLLPDYVTGGGRYGTDPGSQLVLLRVLAPYGGRLEWVEIDDERIRGLDVTDLDGRPVVTVPVLVADDEVVVTWLLRSGAGQSGDPRVTVTPGIESGSQSRSVPSAC